jgi:hypothetical protein
MVVAEKTPLQGYKRANGSTLRGSTASGRSLDPEMSACAVEDIVCTSGSSGNDGWKFQGNAEKMSQSFNSGQRL